MWPTSLQKLQVRIQADSLCEKTYGLSYKPQNMLCAGSLMDLQGGCIGEAGGPLVCYQALANSYYLAGVISWGRGCGLIQYPGVCSEVASFTEFIQGFIHFMIWILFRILFNFIFLLDPKSSIDHSNVLHGLFSHSVGLGQFMRFWYTYIIPIPINFFNKSIIVGYMRINCMLGYKCYESLKSNGNQF